MLFNVLSIPCAVLFHLPLRITVSKCMLPFIRSTLLIYSIMHIQCMLVFIWAIIRVACLVLSRIHKLNYRWTSRFTAYRIWYFKTRKGSITLSILTCNSLPSFWVFFSFQDPISREGRKANGCVCIFYRRVDKEQNWYNLFSYFAIYLHPYIVLIGACDTISGTFLIILVRSWYCHVLTKNLVMIDFFWQA